MIYELYMFQNSIVCFIILKIALEFNTLEI